MRVLGVIPARYESSRFPGKPLVDIGGKSMIQRVYEQCKKTSVLTDVVVATDDQRIMDHVIKFGGRAMMTSSSHESGTQRCGEVLFNLEDEGEEYDVLVNIQGDEPFIDPSQIEKVVAVFEDDPSSEVATLAKKIESKEELFSPHVVKVVMTEVEEDEISRDALYFSRSTIPFLRDLPQEDWLKKHDFYKHIGIYAFSVEELHHILQLEPSELEKNEGLEQLRWLANHFTIQVAETEIETIGIDTPEDIEKALSLI